MFVKLFWVALGGALGTLARYGMSSAVQKYLGPGFPWGTAAVNILGSFFFGVLWAVAMGRGILGPEMRTVLLVGFMGSFTTFATFISDTGQLLADSEILMGMGNVTFQIVTGTGMFFLGLALGKSL